MPLCSFLRSLNALKEYLWAQLAPCYNKLAHERSSLSLCAFGEMALKGVALRKGVRLLQF
jgi:hypothetical protein